MLTHTTKIYSLLNQYLSRRGRSSFSEAAKQEGTLVIREWARRYQAKHFEQHAYQRYSYAPRTARWNAIKLRDVWKDHGRIVYPEKPPKPLVWTGDMRSYVLSRIETFNIKASAGWYAKFAGGKGWTASVTGYIRTPHPLNPKNRGEVKRMIPDEWRRLSWMWFVGIKERMRPVRKSAALYKG